MCVGCYALSVMTLVSPVSEAPQPVNVPELNQSAVQVQKRVTPVEVRKSINFILQRLPKTSNAQPLRDAFRRMQAQLVGVNDQEEVYEIVNDHMLSLSKQVDSAPNSLELLQILEDLGVERHQPQASIFLNPQGAHWGWLS